MIRIEQVFVFILFLCCAACQSRPGADTTIPPLPDLTKNHTDIVLQALTDAIDDDPRLTDAYQKRALTYLDLGNTQAALDDINRAIGLEISNSDYFRIRSTIYRKMEEPNLALQSALQAEKLNNQTPEFYLLMGDLYQERKEYAKARQYLNRALEISPNNGEVYYFKAKVAAETGDTLAALKFYETAMQKRPDFTESYNRMAEIHNATHVNMAALSFVKDGLRVDSSNAMLYYNGGNSYRLLGMPDSAKFYYAKAVRLKPSLYLANFQAGLLYFADRDYLKSQHLFEQALKYKPDLPKLNYFLGMSYEFTGKRDEAIGQYATAMKLDPNDYKAAESFRKLSKQITDEKSRLLAKAHWDSLEALRPKVTKPKKVETLEPIAPIIPQGSDVEKDPIIKKEIEKLPEIKKELEIKKN